MHAHNREAKPGKMRLVDPGKDNSILRPDCLISAPNSTLTERVISFIDRYMAPVRGQED